MKLVKENVTLPPEFYTRTSVTQIAKELLGKKLISTVGGELASGIITETEAYEGVIDKASHAYGGRLTKRTKTMYEEGGIAYIYLCYGIHHLLNVVTNVKGTPHAVLIRALEPKEGIEIMLKRRNKTKLDRTLCGGPGALTQALGITVQADGTDLRGNRISIQDVDKQIIDSRIIKSPRVGVDYAEYHALWPYRFRIKNNLWTSPAK